MPTEEGAPPPARHPRARAPAAPLVLPLPHAVLPPLPLPLALAPARARGQLTDTPGGAVLLRVTNIQSDIFCFNRDKWKSYYYN